jgi:hypothetical protein
MPRRPGSFTFPSMAKPADNAAITCGRWVRSTLKMGRLRHHSARWDLASRLTSATAPSFADWKTASSSLFSEGLPSEWPGHSTLESPQAYTARQQVGWSEAVTPEAHTVDAEPSDEAPAYAPGTYPSSPITPMLLTADPILRPSASPPPDSASASLLSPCA